MVYNYNQCLEQWQSDYRIGVAVKKGLLYKIEKGIYSDTPIVSDLEIISVKYPRAIITMDTAFYYHGLTDVIPDEYWIATDKSSRTLSDSRVRQLFINSDLLNLGVTSMKRRGAVFKIYDKERMLIELLRYKNKLPYDYYKEVLGKYRSIIQDMDIERIQEYAVAFPKSRIILAALDSEVF